MSDLISGICTIFARNNLSTALPLVPLFQKRTHFIAFFHKILFRLLKPCSAADL